MYLLCLDLEGVLVPEIWKAVARHTGISDFLRTTRDEPDYDRLMQYRLQLLAKHRLSLGQIAGIIETMEPFAETADFLRETRARMPVIILSDTFQEFFAPLAAKLDFPVIFCHSLLVDDSGQITGYRLRQQNQKEQAVQALQSLQYRVIAAGDSFNDIGMLETADHPLLFRPAEGLLARFPAVPAFDRHSQMLEHILKLIK